MPMPDYRHLFAAPKPETMDYEPDPLGRLDQGRHVEREPRFPDPGWPDPGWMPRGPTG